MDRPAASAERLQVHGADVDYCVGTWRNVLLTNWRDKVQADPLESTRALSFGLRDRYPDGIVVYNVIEHGIPMPDPDVRELASEILGQTGGHVLCTATMIIGEGIWAGMARAALATITLFARTPHPQRVFATLEDAAEWACPNVAPAGTAAGELAAVAEELRGIESV